MDPPSSWHSRGSRVDRLRREIDRRWERVTVVVTLTYLCAGAGLGVTFLGGTDDPTTNLSAVGIAFLFASFVGLFYLSVTVHTLGGRSKHR